MSYGIELPPSGFKSTKTAPTGRKQRGGYYTPPVLADYLCGWAIRHRSDRIVEPSCGDGSFVSSAVSRLGPDGSITAVEIVPEEIRKAQAVVKGTEIPIDWRCGDFFQEAANLLVGARYDAAVGNPPFIRFQYFEREARERAFRLVRSLGYHPNGLANAWVAFVQLAAELVRDGGRLAMVVPAELLQVGYAAEFRDRLPRLFDEVSVVAFDQLVFPEIQQEVLLLLADGRNRNPQSYGKLYTRQVTDGAELLHRDTQVSHLPERHTHPDMKWTSLFLEDQEFGTLRNAAESETLDRLGQLASVDVGIVTGRNSFFVVTDGTAERLGLNGYAMDVVGRTAALKSIRFTDADLREYRAAHRSKLINLNGQRRTAFSATLQAYIQAAEQEGVDRGYKCRIRTRWFDVPSVYVPDAFLFRQIHQAPLLVANLAGATSTDTIHRVRVAAGVRVDRLCGSMVNSLTFAFAEVYGRSYGGGVLELEPREAERLLVPYRGSENLDLDYLDQQLRAGNLEAALDHGDRVLLDGCGFQRQDIKRARAAWNRLRLRRHRRK